jgi:hypothetical protein
MRSFLLRNRWATISMVVLMLFGTSGLALSRMTCLMAGHSVLRLGTMEDCCPTREVPDEPTVSPVCCVMGVAKADAAPFLSGASAGLPMVAAVVAVHPPLLTIDAVHRPVEGGTDRAPPLLLPADRLTMLSVLRV